MVTLLEQKSAYSLRLKSRWVRLLIVLLVIASLFGAAVGVIHQLTPVSAASGDWYTFLHDPQRTAAGNDTAISASNASQLGLKWAFKTGGPIAASPTVVGNTVYVGSWDGYEYALNATTGALIWKTFLGQTTAPCYPQLAGVSSAADVEGGVLYIGGGDSYWYALDPATGNVLWKIFVGDNTKGWYNWASPLIYNGYAYVGTASVGDCPLIPGQLLQISLSTHQIVNTFNGVPQGQVGAGIWTTPSIDPVTNTIFVTTGTRNQDTQMMAEAVIALDANTLAVKSSWAISNSMQAVDSDFGNTPILFNDSHGNPLVAAVNKNSFLYAWNRNNLSAGPVWSQVVTLPGSCPQCGDGSASSGAFANGTLFQAGGSVVINGVGYRGSVNALNPDNGNFLWQHPETGPVIPGLAYSNGLIVDGAGATVEVLDASSGTRLWSYTTGGYLYAAPSVAYGQIYTGGTDDNVYAFGLTTPTTPPPDPNCPSSWTCQDIGTPLPAGTESAPGASWSVQVGGAGVGGASDQFRLISQAVSGNSQVSAQVVSQSLTTGAAQAGVMMRQSNDPTAPYYAVFLEPNNELLVQYRTAFGGATTTVTKTGIAPPMYLEIQRVGDQFQAATSSDGATYTLVSGGTATLPMPASIQAGVAAASGTQGTTNTVSYNAVALGTPSTPPNPPSSPSPCLSGWSCQDIGNPTLVGDQSLNGVTVTLKGAGTSINGYGDQFHFVWQTLAGDGTISAHITSQTNTNGAAQAGVMLRQSTDPASPYYAAFITPGNGIVVQYRMIQGLKTNLFTGVAGSVPIYLMVARSGTNYCTYSSPDGTNWSIIIGSCATVPISGPVLAGLAVSSDNVGALSAVTFDTINVGTTPPVPPNTCTGAWNCSDVGYPSLSGAQYLVNGTWTVQGSGSDIYGTYDQFRYVWQTLTTDGSVSAHITAQANTDLWAKAGVMMRLTTDPGSPYYAIEVTPGNGIVIQYRTVQGGGAQQAVGITGTVPNYLWVDRSGTTFSAYTSSDGVNWSWVVGSSVTISSMSGSIMAGLAVTSHNGSVMGQAAFDTVNIGTSIAPPSCASGWTCADIGSPALVGGQTVNNGTWSVTAAGSDIWGYADQFHYDWQTMTGDGSVSAHVTSLSSPSSWAKVGVMLRQTSDSGSPYYGAFVTPGNGITIQYRKTQAGGSGQQTATTGTVPVYLWINRSGNTYSTYTSSDGLNWTLVPKSSITFAMNNSILAGLAFTSHNAKALGTAVFDTVNVSSAVVPPGCASGWTCADIGAPTLTGNQYVNGGTWTVNASGNDIWGTSDQYHFDWQSMASDGSVSAHVASESNTDPWTKAGVMLRLTTDPGSPYYGILVTPGHGIQVQYRTAQGGTTQQIAAGTGTAPTYLMVSRTGTTFTAYTSSDGSNWTLVAGSSVTIGSLTGTLLAGLATTSHNSTLLATVVYDTISTGANTAPACSNGWSCADIGAPALVGSQTLSGGTWTIQAAGADIYGISDQFHFVWQSLPGDGSITARIASLTSTSGWAKAGVMLRQTTDPGSAYYAILVTRSNGIVVQWRTAQGAKTMQISGISGAAPAYIAVARQGNTFTAYTSSNGTNWTLVPNSTVTLTGITGTVLAGMAFTSHNANALGTATFDTVNIGATIP